MKPYRTTRKIIFIGRQEHCHIRPDDPALSRQHVTLAVHEQSITVLAMLTKNGTRLNGKLVPVGTEVEAKSGDILFCGAHALALVLESNDTGGTELVVMDAHEYLQQQREIEARQEASPAEGAPPLAEAAAAPDELPPAQPPVGDQQ